MFKVKNIVALAVAAASLALSGCASIIGDTQYPVAITSSPSNAHFEVRNQKGLLVHSGETPSTVVLPSSGGFFDGETYSIKYSMEGREDTVVVLDSTVSGWYWGNILLGGVIGMLIVDPATGAMYKLPETASGNLGQAIAKAGGSNQDLKIVNVSELSEVQRAELVEIK